MISAIFLYFVLGIVLGALDLAGSRYFREGRQQRRMAEHARSLKYLLEHYQPTSFEDDCRKPEYRDAVASARSYYEEFGQKPGGKRLDELLARLEGKPAAAPRAALQRTYKWLEREKLTPLPVRSKAVVAVGIALLMDLWTLASWGIGAAAWALLATLIEAPALLLGLLAAPGAVRGFTLLWSSVGSGTPELDARRAAEQIERDKRSLYLRLTAAPAPVPYKEPERYLPS